MCVDFGKYKEMTSIYQKCTRNDFHMTYITWNFLLFPFSFLANGDFHLWNEYSYLTWQLVNPKPGLQTYERLLENMQILITADVQPRLNEAKDHVRSRSTNQGSLATTTRANNSLATRLETQNWI